MKCTRWFIIDGTTSRTNMKKNHMDISSDIALPRCLLWKKNILLFVLPQLV